MTFEQRQRAEEEVAKFFATVPQPRLLALSLDRMDLIALMVGSACLAVNEAIRANNDAMVLEAGRAFQGAAHIAFLMSALA